MKRTENLNDTTIIWDLMQVTIRIKPLVPTRANEYLQRIIAYWIRQWLDTNIDKRHIDKTTPKALAQLLEVIDLLAIEGIVHGAFLEQQRSRIYTFRAKHSIPIYRDNNNETTQPEEES